MLADPAIYRGGEECTVCDRAERECEYRLQTCAVRHVACYELLCGRLAMMASERPAQTAHHHLCGAIHSDISETLGRPARESHETLDPGVGSSSAVIRLASDAIVAILRNSQAFKIRRPSP
jgi:hypothetical protein